MYFQSLAALLAPKSIEQGVGVVDGEMKAHGIKNLWSLMPLFSQSCLIAGYKMQST